jgi:hypothetical protein
MGRCGGLCYAAGHRCMRITEIECEVMIDEAVRERANDLIERIFALDEAVSNVRAFRASLENLHARDLPSVKEPHITAIVMVRAGILRAAISTVMACLDPSDRRGNRASVGQIIDMLKDQEVVEALREPAISASQDEAIARVRRDYESLTNGDLFERGRRLRNDAIAHLLIPDDPTPTVTYETIYGLHDIAERLLTDLYLVSSRGTPQFIGHRGRLEEHARIFWDTYFAGMNASTI